LVFSTPGKTTLFDHLLRPAPADAAVMINEFVEVAADHHLVDKIDDTTVVFSCGYPH